MPDGFQPLSRKELEQDWEPLRFHDMRLSALHYLGRCDELERLSDDHNAPNELERQLHLAWDDRHKAEARCAELERERDELHVQLETRKEIAAYEEERAEAAEAALRDTEAKLAHTEDALRRLEQECQR
jgi:chromosome segregation ATPase